MPDYRTRLREILLETGCALCITAIILSPFLYFSIFYDFPRGPITPLEPFSSDLLNLIVPTPMQYFGGPQASRLFKISWAAGNFAEVTAYLGLPLILLIGLFYLTYRGSQRRLVLISGLLLPLVASFGPRLLLSGHAIVLMPWHYFSYLPFISKALPGRFMLFAYLDLAVIAAIQLAANYRPFLSWAMVLSGILLFTPDLRVPYWMGNIDTPEFFTSKGAYRHLIRPNQTLLVFPYGTEGASALWQAQTGMYFKIAGGYMGNYVPPELTHWPIVSAFYEGNVKGDFRIDFRDFVYAHHVDAIVVAKTAQRPWRNFFNTLGMVSVQSGGVFLYFVPRTWRSERQVRAPHPQYWYSE